MAFKGLHLSDTLWINGQLSSQFNESKAVMAVIKVSFKWNEVKVCSLVGFNQKGLDSLETRP